MKLIFKITWLHLLPFQLARSPRLGTARTSRRSVPLLVVVITIPDVCRIIIRIFSFIFSQQVRFFLFAVFPPFVYPFLFCLPTVFSLCSSERLINSLGVRNICICYTCTQVTHVPSFSEGKTWKILLFWNFIVDPPHLAS